MAIIIGKGCIEAIYGLMWWKGLMLLLCPETITFWTELSPYYTMLWDCVLVRFESKNMKKVQEKHEKKRNWLAILPYVWCNIERFSHIFLAFFIFLAFSLHFGYQHVGIQIARKTQEEREKYKKTRVKQCIV